VNPKLSWNSPAAAVSTVLLLCAAACMPPCVYRYRRTNDVLHFIKELEAAINKKLTKQSQQQGRQQQQRQQPGSQPSGGQAAHHNQLREQYAAAAAAAPDLDSMSVVELRSFVRQVGEGVIVAPRGRLALSSDPGSWCC